ncbi:MAG TPA: PP2C family protein-serine/threonine phosphatase [Acidimicrobiales bacterium]|nr:PP2C family protein-serine/threonine phosphatase [Acidimicrobiales bacterium]
MVDRAVLGAVAAGFLLAALLWARSSRRLLRAARRIGVQNGVATDGYFLARVAFDKDFHTAVLYGALGMATAVIAATGRNLYYIPLLLAFLPIAISFRFAARFLAAARLAEGRAGIERRAEEVLAQEQLAPLRWSSRLAPTDLPDIDGFQVGTLYEPGAGAMAGDFYDVFRTGPERLAAVIGDVSGHGIDPSITAFQVKYLLRVFLRQFRDPGQALEALNPLLSEQVRPEELVSLCVVIFDEAAGTLRYSSAGHPAAWLWRDGDVRPLRSTGPLLTLVPDASFLSREVDMATDDVLLLYTDGLAEARAGDNLFGEERIAAVLRRDAGRDPARLCRALRDAAREFATEPLADDVAILAVRRN